MNENINSFEKIYKISMITLGIIILIGIIIGSISIIFYEVYSAKSYCNSINGKYIFNLKQGHQCNNQTLIKYNTGWDFYREINITKLFQEDSS